MAWKSPSTINATQGMDSFIPYLNTVTNFLFGRMFMIAIFVIFTFGYLRSKGDDYIGALAVASYVTFIVGLLFWVIGIVSGLDFGVVIGVVIITSVLLFSQKKVY